MSDRFAARTGLLAAGQAAVKASHIVIAVVLVRLLAPAEWNAAAFLMSVYVTAVAFGTLGIQHALIFHLPRVPSGEQRALVVRSVWLLLGVGVLVIAVLSVVGPSLDRSGVVARDGWVWLGIAVALELPGTCLATAMIATERVAGAAVWDIAGTVLLIGAVTGAAAAGLGVEGVLLALIVTGALRLVVGGNWLLRRLPSDGGRGDPAALIAMISYGLPLGLLLSVSMLNRVVDKWLLASFRPDDVGVYSVAAHEAPLLMVVPYAGGAALAAALVRAFRDGNHDEARTHWLHLTSRMAKVVVPLGVGVALAGRDLMDLLFTDRVVRGTFAFQVFQLVAIHRMAEYGLLLRTAGRTRALFEVAGITLVANAVLAGIGAYVGGMNGAATGTAIATLLGWRAVVWRIADTLGVPVRQAMAWKSWLTSVAIAGTAAAATLVVVQPLPLQPLPAIAFRWTLFAALYLTGWRLWRRSRRSADPVARWIPGAPTSSEPVPA
jgi:O-antigen/teichoic acid export membrane protein